MDVFEPKVTAVTLSKNGKIEKSLVETGVIGDVVNGKSYTIENIEEDGIYRVTCTVVDKAGNEYDSVYIVDGEGNPTTVEKTARDTLLSFSVNRNGSTFDLDENTLKLVDNYYVQNVNDDVVITEINADEIEKYQVTLNDKTLEEGRDYSITKEGGDEDWTHYVYKIDKSLFSAEGEYNVVVSTTDKAKNNAFSDVKNAGIDFVVDRTAPKVTVSGMQSGGRYQTERQTVTIIPTDDGGALASLMVALVDSKGNIESKLVDLSGVELLYALEEQNGIITIELDEGLFQNVRIVCTDYSVDEDGNVNTYDETFGDVSVSSSSVKIFWANRPLRYTVITGSAVGLGGGSAAIVRIFRRRKFKSFVG
jgi:hypothetical protein